MNSGGGGGDTIVANAGGCCGGGVHAANGEGGGCAAAASTDAASTARLLHVSIVWTPPARSVTFRSACVRELFNPPPRRMPHARGLGQACDVEKSVGKVREVSRRHHSRV